jgi:methionyl aminopeptidase
MGVLRSQTDLRSLREAGRITREILEALCEAANPGVSTVELETLANRLLAQNRSTAPFKGFEGFNQAICVSLNEEIVNGPPTRERTLQEGDVVSIAMAAEHRGIHAKAARTIYLGMQPSEDIARLLTGTSAVIPAVISASKTAKTLNELLPSIPVTAGQYRLTVISGLGGAGIGKKLHEWPPVPNDPAALEEVVPLDSGLAFTLMPMFSLGESIEMDTHEDGWTYLTRDRAIAAHVADTLLMTPEGLVTITGQI